MFLCIWSTGLQKSSFTVLDWAGSGCRRVTESQIPRGRGHSVPVFCCSGRNLLGSDTLQGESSLSHATLCAHEISQSHRWVLLLSPSPAGSKGQDGQGSAMKLWVRQHGEENTDRHSWLRALEGTQHLQAGSPAAIREQPQLPITSLSFCFKAPAAHPCEEEDGFHL